MDKVTKLYYEIASAQAQLSYGKSEQLHRFALHYGLESSTSLSTEGVLSWMSDKVKQLGHFVTIKVNEACAAITGANDAVKKRIAKAKEEGPDHHEELPLSGADILRISAGIVMVSAAVCSLAKMKSRREAALARHEDIIKEMRERTRAARSSAPESLHTAMTNTVQRTEGDVKAMYRRMADTHVETAKAKHRMIKQKLEAPHLLPWAIKDLKSMEQDLLSAKKYAETAGASPEELKKLGDQADLAKRYAEELRRKM